MAALEVLDARERFKHGAQNGQEKRFSSMSLVGDFSNPSLSTRNNSTMTEVNVSPDAYKVIIFFNPAERRRKTFLGPNANASSSVTGYWIMQLSGTGALLSFPTFIACLPTNAPTASTAYNVEIRVIQTTALAVRAGALRFSQFAPKPQLFSVGFASSGQVLDVGDETIQPVDGATNGITAWLDTPLRFFAPESYHSVVNKESEPFKYWSGAYSTPTSLTVTTTAFQSITGTETIFPLTAQLLLNDLDGTNGWFPLGWFDLTGYSGLVRPTFFDLYTSGYISYARGAASTVAPYTDAPLAQGFEGSISGRFVNPSGTIDNMAFVDPLLIVPVFVIYNSFDTSSGEPWSELLCLADGTIMNSAALPQTYTVANPPPGSFILDAGISTCSFDFSIDLFERTPIIPFISAVAPLCYVVNINTGAVELTAFNYTMNYVNASIPTYQSNATERGHFGEFFSVAGSISSLSVSATVEAVIDVLPSYRMNLLSDATDRINVTEALTEIETLDSRIQPISYYSTKSMLS